VVRCSAYLRLPQVERVQSIALSIHFENDRSSGHLNRKCLPSTQPFVVNMIYVELHWKMVTSTRK